MLRSIARLARRLLRGTGYTLAVALPLLLALVVSIAGVLTQNPLAPPPPLAQALPERPTHDPAKRTAVIVAGNSEQCIGCRYCVTACPYSARTFDSGDFYSNGTPAMQPYEQLVTYEYGKTYDRARGDSPVGNVRKCTFCLHRRLNEGMLPQCTTSCIGTATYFGDLNDPESLVSELAGRPNATSLKEELGTKPKVFYLM
jgi:molybdopterin-containing oxidoreductase family iron-sulfur binding subunit